MASKDAKQVLKEVSNVRKEITALRKKLNELNDNKESIFEDKEKHSKKIISHISEIKKLKRERDEYTKKVRQLKTEREELNKSIKVKSNELKELKDQLFELRKTKNIKNDPIKIRDTIEELEYQIETEGMSFEKEKKVMQKINELKKQFDGAKDIIGITDNLTVLRKEIRDFRRKANEVHKSVQDNAKNSQEKHEKILEISKIIDEIKKDEQEKFSKFSSAKEDFNKINDMLKEKLVIMNRLNEDLKKHKIKARKATKEKVEKTLAEKSKQVDEKIKQRKKLTTEDLLVYQRSVEK